MMKKLIMLLTICMMCLLAVSASAAEKNDEAPPINWEISMMPKPTAEEIEAARWSIVLENTMGVYAYDMDSLYFPEEKNGVVNKDLVNVVVKTVFTDKELLKKMNKTYAEKLAKKEKPEFVYELHLAGFMRPDAVIETDEDGNETVVEPAGFYNYRELAEKVTDYVTDMGLSLIHI